MMLSLSLLLAHFLYDTHWYTEYHMSSPSRRKFMLVAHSLTWALLITFVLAQFNEMQWWSFPFLGATHFLIDRWKVSRPDIDANMWAFYVDQAAHILTLGIVALGHYI